jgi:hypothetical protein
MIVNIEKNNEIEIPNDALVLNSILKYVSDGINFTKIDLNNNGNYKEHKKYKINFKY